MAALRSRKEINLHNPSDDRLLNQPPSDTVHALSFSPHASFPKWFLSSGSWDKNMRCWEVHSTGHSRAIGTKEHDAPVLDVSWSADGQNVFSAGMDKQARMWSLTSDHFLAVATHEAPIRHIFHCSDIGSGSSCLITGSWDKTMRIWDVRARTELSMVSISLSERVYCMDIRAPLIVVGTADNRLRVYDIRNPSVVFHEKLAQLRYQLRYLAAFPDQSGYAVGSIEGRVSIDHVQQKDPTSPDFSFTCHRSADNDLYAVNSISFHEKHGTFATAGGDGGFTFWDKEDRCRLKQFRRLPQPITTATFSADGNIFAYAVGYDWSTGTARSYPSSGGKYVLLHAVMPTEVLPKKNRKDVGERTRR